jgi:TrmH family RNA methyltransferase
MISKNEVKYIQSLYHKKKRGEEGVFVAEGPKLLEELLHSSFQIQKIYALQQWADEHSAFASLITVVENDELERLSAQKTPNTVLAIVKELEVDTYFDLRNELFIALDGIQDPGNLGTIIRIADWFGIKHIVASEDTVDMYNSKVIQSTMGSFTRVLIRYTSLVEFFQNNSIEVYAAVLDGTPVQQLQPIQKGCLLIGNEGKGISDELNSFLQHKVTIPKIGGAESLNAGVATGIILSHMILR